MPKLTITQESMKHMDWAKFPKVHGEFEDGEGESEFVEKYTPQVFVPNLPPDQKQEISKEDAEYYAYLRMNEDERIAYHEAKTKEEDAWLLPQILKQGNE